MIPQRKPVSRRGDGGRPARSSPTEEADFIETIPNLPRIDDIIELEDEKAVHSTISSLPQPDLTNGKENQKPGQLPTGRDKELDLPRPDTTATKSQPIRTLPPDNPIAIPVPQPVRVVKPTTTAVEEVSTSDSDPPLRLPKYTRPTFTQRNYETVTSDHGYRRTYGTSGPAWQSKPIVTPPARESRSPRVGHCWKVYNIMTIIISLIVLVGGYSYRTRYFPLAVIENSVSSSSNIRQSRYVWGYSGICYVDTNYTYCAHAFVKYLDPPVVTPASVLEESGYKNPRTRLKIFKASASMLILALMLMLIALICICSPGAEGCVLTFMGSLLLIPYFILVHLAIASFWQEFYMAESDDQPKTLKWWGTVGHGGAYISVGMVLIDINLVITFLFFVVYTCRFCN